MLSPRIDIAPGPGSRHPLINHYDFQPLSMHEWRIIDSRHPNDSVDALVGFVARHDDAYYATRLQHPLESVPFASFDAVAAFIARIEIA